MKKIFLTRGYVAMVDDRDFEALVKFNWQSHVCTSGVYAVRGRLVSEGAGPATIWMHRFILPGVGLIDHDDGDGLNNQRYNLKPSSKSLNAQAFRRKKKNGYSRFRGVSWCKRCKKWVAQIRALGKREFLGYFSDEKSAARAYDTAAKRLFKHSSAALNFPT